MPKRKPSSPVERVVRSYETRIKNMRSEIARIRRNAEQEVERISLRIARAEVLLAALKRGELKA